MIEIKGLKKILGKNLVLDDINLRIENGTIFGLVGINGAGKSTLLRTLSGVYKADDGQVLIDGEDVYENNFIKRNIFFVNDEFYFPRNSTINSIKKMYQEFYSFDKESYFKYLNLFKLDPNRKINNYSKGMKRQVSLLMALSIKPKILLLDEAFDGLDPLVRLNFKKALSELMENDTIVVISSHNLKELEDICDSFGILDSKTIKTSGQMSENLELVNKYQIAFDDYKTAKDFKEFELINFNSIGRVNTLIIRGNKEEVYQKLMDKNPILLEVLNINFEELFIFEVEGDK